MPIYRLTCDTAQITSGVRPDGGTSLLRAGVTDFAQQALHAAIGLWHNRMVGAPACPGVQVPVV